MGKGSDYERLLCERLSLWWTDGERDDVFWRTAGSGARATTRHKAGKKTNGQHGDIGALDTVGAPLVSVLSIELKRGYPKSNVHDSFDRTVHVPSEWELHIEQAARAKEESGSYSWVLLTKRDRRKELVWMPFSLYEDFQKQGCFKGRGLFMRVLVTTRGKDKRESKRDIACVTLGRFLKEVRRNHIISLYEKMS